MKTETRLDCATFQLDESRTRCELWITAGNETERLASGSLKPFLGHLKEAREQIARGQSSIKLQVSASVPPSTMKALWFTKGTMERFVRFVTTPDVLERASIVEMERCQLEEAISILAAGEQQLKQATGVIGFEGSEDVPDEDAAGDNSKNQLLVAMDARRIMLQKEELNAFSRAAAAGFDMSCMADMVDFADCFGATRLREACLKFASIYRKMQEKGQLSDLEAETQTVDLTSEEKEDTTHKNSKGRRTWDMAANDHLQQNAPEKSNDNDLGSQQRESTAVAASTPAQAQNQSFRVIPDSPPNFADADSPSTEGTNSPQEAATSRRLSRRASSPRRRSCSPMRRVQIARSGSKRTGMVVIRNINYASPGSQDLKQPTLGNDSTEDSDSVLESEDNKDELSRRLSVQDAISLFERKQRDSLVAQSAKAELRRNSMDAVNSGKSVLRRWSSIGDNNSTTEHVESDVGGMSGTDHSQTDQALDSGQARQPPQVQASPQQDDRASALKLEERRKSWITAQSDLEWKFQQLKLQEAALPAARSSRDTVRSPPSQHMAATKQFGFQYRGQKSKAPVSMSWSATSEKDLSAKVRQAEVTVELKKNAQRHPEKNAQRHPDKNAQRHPDKNAQRHPEDQGRFYEQYREKRDAKIRQESDLKRAERESKLKAMQEVLDRRKAELAAGGRSTERQAKPADSNRKGMQPGRTVTSTRSPIVPSSQTTPRAAPRKQLTPEARTNVARKLSPGPQKPPSSRALTSSPKLPKSSVSAAQRRPSNMSENPLSRSMPSLSELRKENTRPLRSSPQSKVVPPAKNMKSAGNIIRNKAVSKVLPLEPNGVVSSEVQRHSEVRDNDVKRKSATVLPLGGDYQSLKLMELQAQVIPLSPVCASQEPKPFLRKGRGIGPGAGPGVLKVKAFSSSELEEDNKEAQIEDYPAVEAAVTSLDTTSSQAWTPVFMEAEAFQVSGSVRESQEMDIDSSSEVTEVQNFAAEVSSSALETVRKNEEPPGAELDAAERLVYEDNTKAIDWIDKRAQIASTAAEASPSKLTLMQQLASQEYVGSSSPQPSLNDRRSLASVGSSSPCSSASGVPQLTSDLDGVKIEKSQRKKWGSSQKPVAMISSNQPGNKEAPKGLKRLLKFGRKKSNTTEWVSASTTSEGEDTDECRDSNGSSYLRRSTEAFSKEHDTVNGNGSRSFFSLSSFRSKGSELKTRF